jgi:DNA polymerase III epsilon subunit-like protein
MPIPRAASKVHKIYDRTVAEAPTFPAAWEAFMNFVTGIYRGPYQTQKPVVLVGHNSRTFDEPKVRQELLRHGITESECHQPPAGTFSGDTLQAFRAAKSTGVTLETSRGDAADLSQMSLEVLYGLFVSGDLMKNAHDALVDARAVLQILERTSKIHPFLTLLGWLETPTSSGKAKKKARLTSPEPAMQSAEEGRLSTDPVALEEPSVDVVTVNGRLAVESVALRAPPMDVSEDGRLAMEEAAPLYEAATASGSPPARARPRDIKQVHNAGLPVCEQCLLPFSWAAPHACDGKSRGRHPPVAEALNRFAWIGNTP